MNKKILVLVTLCLWVLPLGMLAVEKARTIEFVANERTKTRPSFSYEANNPATSENFSSSPLLTLHMPPMPGYDTIFFELSARATYQWSGFQLRKSLAGVYFQLINPNIIPEGMEVTSFGGLGIPWDTIENNALNKGTQNYDRIYKSIMNFSSSRSIYVEYKTGGVVPDELAIPIIKALIDNGYDVEIKVYGTIQGAEVFALAWACLEITRLSKK